ncbi:MAG: DinB family protein [Chloroflexi bacterium]|nr:DinB family protein [Chloroflexota bacterium]
MKATEYARSQVEGALDFLATCAKDMDEAQYNHKPDGKCNPAGKLHAHALSAADFFVTGMLAGQPSKWPEFAGQTGLPANAMEIWGSDATIKPSVMDTYASAIKDPILAYIDTLTDEDLDRKIDTRFAGEQTVAWVLQLVTSHTLGHAGEIAAVKGTQGLQGLPF